MAYFKTLKDCVTWNILQAVIWFETLGERLKSSPSYTNYGTFNLHEVNQIWRVFHSNKVA